MACLLRSTSHDMDDLEEMAQRILLISNGKISYDGGFDSLHKIAGGLCRIILTMKGGISAFRDCCH